MKCAPSTGTAVPRSYVPTQSPTHASCIPSSHCQWPHAHVDDEAQPLYQRPLITTP